MSTRHTLPLVVAGAIALLCGAVPVQAQSDKPRQSGQQSQRKPPIDLETQAKSRRPGQVMPGDAQPGQVAPPPPASRPAPAPVEEVKAAPVAPVSNDATLEAIAGATIQGQPGAQGSRPLVMPTFSTSENGVLQNPPPAAGYAPARVRVADAGPSGDEAQWRASVGGWQPLQVEQITEARVEVRAGLESDITLIVEDSVEVRVGRVGRVAIERATEPDGSTTVSLVVARGQVTVRPLPGARPVTASKYLARVRTPDRSFALTLPAELTYDAFSGTRVRLASAPAAE